MYWTLEFANQWHFTKSFHHYIPLLLCPITSNPGSLLSYQTYRPSDIIVNTFCIRVTMILYQCDLPGRRPDTQSSQCPDSTTVLDGSIWSNRAHCDDHSAASAADDAGQREKLHDFTLHNITTTTIWYIAHPVSMLRVLISTGTVDGRVEAVSVEWLQLLMSTSTTVIILPVSKTSNSRLLMPCRRRRQRSTPARQPSTTHPAGSVHPSWAISCFVMFPGVIAILGDCDGPP